MLKVIIAKSKSVEAEIRAEPYSVTTVIPCTTTSARMDTEKYDEVIFIDDDPIFNFLNTTVVKKAKLTLKVQVFDQAPKALTHLRKALGQQASSRKNLILLDINMPDVDGWGFLNCFEEMPSDATKHYDIFMLSSSEDPTDIDKSKQFRHVRGFISKPLTVTMLRSIVIPDAAS